MKRLAALSLLAWIALVPCDCRDIAAAEAPKAKYLTDLSRARPQSALSQGPREGCWQLIPYQTAGDPNVKAGTMVGAASFIEAPEIRLPLDASGWHAIYVGYWNPLHAYDGGTTIKVKLGGDPAFVRLKQPEPSLEFKMEGSRYVSHSFLKEVFFTNADLTGRDLALGKVCGPFGEKVYLAYVKLVPLAANEAAALQAGRASTTMRPLQGSIDGLSYFWNNEYRTEEHLLELVEPFRHSHVGKIIWAVCYGESTNYPSRVGTLWGRAKGLSVAQTTNAYVKGETVAAECMKSYFDRGIIPEAVVASHVHKMGLKFDLMFRLGIASFDSLPPRRPASLKGFLASHPQFRMALADGTLVEKASYAYPEVRRFMVSLIEEAATLFDVDGVCLGFVRGPQFLGYDPPVLQEFRRRYGADGAKAGFEDPRMRTVRSHFMTLFVRDVRRVLDEVGRKKGKRLEVSAWAYAGMSQDLDYGLDPVTWVNERLVDSLIGVNDPLVTAAAKTTGCRLMPGVWDIDSNADAADGRKRNSQEVLDRAEGAPIKLKTIGGADVEQGYWETAFSGG